MGLLRQDCMVGLLFAFMPVLAGNTSGDASSPLEIVQLVIRYQALLPRCLDSATLGSQLMSKQLEPNALLACSMLA